MGLHNQSWISKVKFLPFGSSSWHRRYRIPWFRYLPVKPSKLQVCLFNLQVDRVFNTSKVIAEGRVSQTAIGSPREVWFAQSWPNISTVVPTLGQRWSNLHYCLGYSSGQQIWKLCSQCSKLLTDMKFLWWNPHSVHATTAAVFHTQPQVR